MSEKNKPNCPYCKTPMVENSMPMSFRINPNIIVKHVKIHECGSCGFDSVPEDEYERVRLNVQNAAKVKDQALIVLE
jgi:uncharacterized protein with PIN domain